MTTYRREPDGVVLKQMLDLNFDEVSEARPGDVLTFWITALHLPRHVGIYTGSSIVHSYYDVGKTVEHRLTKAWERRIKFVHRWRPEGCHR